jgi:hypothetical protein
LPCSEFFHRELVTTTGFIEAERPIPHGIDDHGLSPSDPAFGIRRRQLAEQRANACRDFILSRIVKCRVPIHVSQNKPEALKETLSEVHNIALKFAIRIVGRDKSHFAAVALTHPIRSPNSLGGMKAVVLLDHPLGAGTLRKRKRPPVKSLLNQALARFFGLKQGR